MSERGTATRARPAAYRLLSALMSRGPQSDLLEAARLSPTIAGALERYPELDAAAADHELAFSLGALPYEGAFLDPDGQVAASAGYELRRTLERLNLSVDPLGIEAEHLASELDALGVLSQRELQAQLLSDCGGAAGARAALRTFLDRHLLRWLPIFGLAVRRLGLAYPGAVVEQIEALVYEHRAELGEPASADLELALPGPEQLLDDPQTSLSDIAAALVRPAVAGTMLTRADIAQLGRSAGLPRGFGERRVMLHNLLESASSYGALAEVTAALSGLLLEDAQALGRARYRAVPRELIAPWRSTNGQARSMLARLAQASARQHRGSARSRNTRRHAAGGAA